VTFVQRLSQLAKKSWNLQQIKQKIIVNILITIVIFIIKSLFLNFIHQD